MKVGIDLSPIQGHHRMRGIGYTLINFINGLPAAERRDNYFIFYVLPFEKSDYGNPLELLDLHDITYEVRPLSFPHRSKKKLPGRLNMLISAYNNFLEIKDLRFGDSRVNSLDDVEAFLQFDQKQSLPRKLGLKKALVVYDIIPYTVEWDYLWSYRTARTLHGFSRKAAARCAVRRWLYLYKIKLNVRRANLLLAISETTRAAFIDSLAVKPGKIVTTPLGVNLPKTTTAKPRYKYTQTSWGYRQRPLQLTSDTSFMLFVGGADKRRRLADLVTAFNRLRGEGYDFKLILAGDSMQGPRNIATEEIQQALQNSSYLEDIIFLGFVDDETRDWLYRNARAFVFPSKYEGFGLPVLEAMAHECPVISYRNEATYEVAGDLPLYADSFDELTSAIANLLEADPTEILNTKSRGLAHAKKYSWDKTAQQIMSNLRA